MVQAKYLLALSTDEEKVAQLLTRDVWTFLGDMVSPSHLYGIKNIPLMPRQGTFSISADPELIQYYLDYATKYTEELTSIGWAPSRLSAATNGFTRKLEDISGQRRRILSEIEKLVS